MTYGMEIHTSAGTKGTFGVNTGRIVATYDGSSISGTTTVSNFDSTKGDYTYVTMDASAYAHDISWNNSTKVFSWGKHTSSIPDSAYPSDFIVYFFHRE